MSEMRKVFLANPYREGMLGSLDAGLYLLLRQVNFPLMYSPTDGMLSADSDRMFSWNHDHCRNTFKKHTGTGELGLVEWLRRATDEDVLNFATEIFYEKNLPSGCDKGWTGCRIMGSVHRGNGYPVWHISLYAKHKDTKNKVFTGPNAPNVAGYGQSVLLADCSGYTYSGKGNSRRVNAYNIISGIEGEVQDIDVTRNPN